MKKLIAIACIAVVSMSGCARFNTTQKDITYDGKSGLPIRHIETKATAGTLIASKSALAKWKASQTDKTQGAEVGGLSQEADASALAEAIARGIVSGVK